MPQNRSSYDVRIDLDLGQSPRAGEPAREMADNVFRLAICGDFSASPGAADSTPDMHRMWRVDRDDFDDVLASVSPSLQLELRTGTTVDVHIRELDDFHPDALLDRVPQFAHLKTLRRDLADPSAVGNAVNAVSSPTAAPAWPAIPTSGNLLDSIVGDDTPATSDTAAGDDLQEFIQRAMAPHLVPRADPRQAASLAQLDETIATEMRALMHHPRFQALESLWRGVHRLVRHVETGERVQIHLIDVTRDHLVADLRGASSALSTSLHRSLAQRFSAEQGGWGLLVAHFAFGGTSLDVQCLERLAGVGKALDAPWLTESHPDLAMGPPETTMAAWRHLRSSPEARFLGLALPRVLLRLPYGKRTDAVETFAFEELEEANAHGSYLWGNPALFCAALQTTEFSERATGGVAGPINVIEGLPLHVATRDGVSTAKPCAEVVMSEDDAMTIIDSGFIPMLSLRDQDAVRVPRIQSIAGPAARLTGRLMR